MRREGDNTLLGGRGRRKRKTTQRWASGGRPFGSRVVQVSDGRVSSPLVACKLPKGREG